MIMSVAVVLSVWIGVGGWGCQSSISIWQIILGFLSLTKTPAILTSAAEDIMWHRIEYLERMGPFSGVSAFGGLLGLEAGVLRNKMATNLQTPFQLGQIGSIQVNKQNHT